MSLKGRHLIDPNQLSLAELDNIITLGLEIYRNPNHYREICKGKILGTLFYEPSTRTRLSFESAMLRMGGTVLGFSDANTSSAKKGESIADTIRVLDDYADLLVMRHPREGAPLLASQYATVPIVNGGDGGHQHPTQTLTDLITIHHNKGKIENLKVAFCGDLLFGRTVHSLLKTLSRFPNMEFVFISPSELKIPKHLKDEVIKSNNVEIVETTFLEKHMSEIDILYMTRIQKERFFNEEEYVKLKDSYILDLQKLRNAKEDLLIMHPLPRVNEIHPEVDTDTRAKYFEQAKLGVYVRMALMALQLGVIESC
ncbi:aspartate carbamoyltransferase [Alkaliphilus metalliredigens QYMF]|uniref:Aspartate carbamoyltransferase catalytic subunit n=1 Tax=Alkaliphilus metalliredigens (strain QYMF) TaxID=293826 RepID=PYRB_ALKMQ|nr:aspartate carbamoyltransferase [Alkaliphilus metalliredigens]A6TVR2.1 RecName: Full=Aspartate carbamoyltransferase catalytic subunit; AltName: Full=Aspartate transcarbamylase; Short=ATCase [Alkaliphilus metalliredigens QYMF]ABR50280.1 aspartate carbamoyltransferase [Alkaliphilus metalliredigens QYMF]